MGNTCLPGSLKASSLVADEAPSQRSQVADTEGVGGDAWRDKDQMTMIAVHALTCPLYIGYMSSRCKSEVASITTGADTR